MRMLLAAGAAIIAISTPVLAQGALGANFNEHYEDVDYRELDAAGAKWIRLFLPMPQVDRAPPSEHGAVTTTLAAGARGYKTIFTLKWPYTRSDFPKPDSAAFQREVARLDAVLPLVMGKVDILVIGNEPYFETREQDRDLDLNVFYEALAKRIIAYRNANCGNDCKTRLYMGALNRMDLKKNRTPSTERWMAFVKATPEIDGVNIHPHVPSIELSRPFLDYIFARMRPEQKFIATEFSLVGWWQQNLDKPVAPAFADKYQAPRNAQNWQIIKAALETPFPKAQWDDFLKMSPWFENRKHYLANQMKIFRDTGRLAVATYGFKQGRSMTTNFGPKSTPWLINSVYARRTVKPNPDGTTAFNYAWIDEFRRMARD